MFLIGYKVRITVILPGSQFHRVQNPRSRAYHEIPAAHSQQPPYATRLCSSLRFLFVSTQILPVLSLSPSQSQLCICADLQFCIPLATQLPCCPARSMTLLLGLTLTSQGRGCPPPFLQGTLVPALDTMSVLFFRLSSPYSSTCICMMLSAFPLPAEGPDLRIGKDAYRISNARKLKM